MRDLTAPTPDGPMAVRVFTPAAEGRWPAVVLFPDIGGVRAAYDAKGQAVADAGYAVLVPNIYHRDVPGPVAPEGTSFRDPAVWPRVQGYARRLTPERQADDFAALLAAAEAAPECAPGPVAAVGYCMTGGFALRMAALHPDRVAAAAGFHSARLAAADDPHSPALVVSAIRARVYLGHADRDASLPPEQIARLDGLLAEAGVPFTTELYAGAAHGFTTRDHPAYDAAADARHLRRLLTLLGETLGAAAGAPHA